MSTTAVRSVTVKPRFSAAASLYLYPPFSSSRSLSRLPITVPSCRLRQLQQVRPLLALVPHRRNSRCSEPDGVRCFSTSKATASLNDPSPNWSNRPPKETILLDGCDFEHWLVVVDPPDPSLTRDEIIKSYIQTLAKVVGSEEEARMKIYSVSTRHYFAFGALVSEELSYKIKELPGVRWVLPDSYLDVKNKDYGGEPFINGEAVPYDPKYHEEWVRNNARANERNRRNDRPRNFDRSRNFERRRENMQNFQNRAPPPPSSPIQNQQFTNQGVPSSVPSNVGGSPSGGYQPQTTIQNIVRSGGSNLNMGGFPTQGSTARLPTQDIRGSQNEPSNNRGKDGSNFGGYQTQVPRSTHNPSYSGYQNQGPHSQYCGEGAYQGGNQGIHPGGFVGNPSPNYQRTTGPYQCSPSSFQDGVTGYSGSNSYQGSGVDHFQP